MLLMLVAALTTPAYDTMKYCRSVGDAGGGSSTIELTCRQQEAEAKARVERREIPERIAKYCGEVGGTVGSYAIFETCVNQEMEAAKSLD